MKFDCDKFIETIREYEFIWRKSHPDHKIRSKCDAAWKEIAEMFNLEGIFFQKFYKKIFL